VYGPEAFSTAMPRAGTLLLALSAIPETLLELTSTMPDPIPEASSMPAVVSPTNDITSETVLPLIVTAATPETTIPFWYTVVVGWTKAPALSSWGISEDPIVLLMIEMPVELPPCRR
jgi:hypothetical protein